MSSTLSLFASQVLGLSPYPIQAAVLDDIDEPGSRVACKAANGSGKTQTIAAPSTVWHPALYPGSITVTTSGVFRQVKEQMWPAIRRMAEKLRRDNIEVEVNLTDMVVKHSRNQDDWSRVVGFSTDDPGKFEGWHGTSLLLLYDEAKTIPDSIYEAGARCEQGQPVRTVMLSSPGGTTGEFYDAFHKHKRLWKTHTITAYDCPHIPAEHIARVIEKWGINHPLVRSMIFAEFMDVAARPKVLNEADFDLCIASPPSPIRGEQVAFCDFAAGGDENVLALRRGNMVSIPAAWREVNTMGAVARFLQLFQKHNLKPEEVWADSDGMGIPICDALAERGFEVRRFKGGSKAYEDRNYVSRISEVWHTAARVIERLEVILPQDPILREQFCNRYSVIGQKGRLGLESKDDLASRGIRSPDRADAVACAIATGRAAEDCIAQFARPSVIEMLELVADEHTENGGFRA